MPKNVYVASMALAALLLLGACGGDAGEPALTEEETVVPSPDDPVEISPEVLQGTVVMDTTGAGTVVDTSTVPADTGSLQ